MPLKRKRFHPDETYDSMVVSYSSDDAISVDPVHGNGNFVCNMNNVNSVTHARKLLPLRAHVPNTYNNVTEGQNTLQFSTEPSLLIQAPDNEFEFEYEVEVTNDHDGHLAGDRYWIPLFGRDQTDPAKSRWEDPADLFASIKVVIPEGRYSMKSLSDALDYAFAEETKADYDRSGGINTQPYHFNQWLTQTDLINSVDPWGWTTIPGSNQSLQLKNVDGKIQFELRNHWSVGHLTLKNIGYIGTSTWPGVVAANDGDRYQITMFFGGYPNPLQFNQYKRTRMRLLTTAAQKTLFGLTADPIWPLDFTEATANQVDVYTATNAVLSPTDILSTQLVIPPGYYNAATLADTIDTLMKAAVHPPEFEWLHRIRTYYDDLPTFDSDVDLRRCEYDATNNEFKFYFSPDLASVPAPTQNLTATYQLANPTNPYGITGVNLQMVADSSLLRLLGFPTDANLTLPNNPPMTILQSVSGGCVNMDIPYVHITSPQISRNNVLTSDSQNRHILATIPMTGVARCEYAHYTGVDIYVDNIDYKGPTSLDKVEFSVTDDKHNQLTIPEHTPVSISLKVYHDDTDP